MEHKASFRSVLVLLLLSALACAATAAGIGTFTIEQNKTAEVGQFGIATLYMDNTWQPQADDLWLNITWDPAIVGYASTDFRVGNRTAATPIGSSGVTFRLADFARKYPNGKVAIADIYFKGLTEGTSPMTIQLLTVRSHGPDSELVADLTTSAIANPGTFVVGGGGPVPTTTGPVPVTTVPITTMVPTTPVLPGDATYAQAKAYYEAGGVAWTNAWGASDFAVIRQYLVEAKTAYTDCLNTANAVNDPANAANLALIRTISTAYIGLADAAIAMYEGADIYTTGRADMTAGSYAAAATSFQTAAGRFNSSETLFLQATTTLQSVTYAGTEYGDGTAYTAVIVPILNAKAAYMGEFATYAEGWQHTALAYQAGGIGDQATFQSEATQAMALFDGLRASAAFGADAAANYNVLASMLV